MKNLMKMKKGLVLLVSQPKDYNFFQEFDYDYINSALIQGIPYFISWQDNGQNDVLFEGNFD